MHTTQSSTTEQKMMYDLRVCNKVHPALSKGKVLPLLTTMYLCHYAKHGCVWAMSKTILVAQENAYDAHFFGLLT